MRQLRSSYGRRGTVYNASHIPRWKTVGAGIVGSSRGRRVRRQKLFQLVCRRLLLQVESCGLDDIETTATATATSQTIVEF